MPRKRTIPKSEEVPASSPEEREKNYREFAKETTGEQTQRVRRPSGVGRTESPDDVWTYRSKYEYSILVSIRDDEDRKIIKAKFRVAFDNGMYVVNHARATRHGITMAEMNKALQAQGSYGIDFVLASGPGYEPTEKVRKFVEATKHSASGRKIAMVDGTRTTGSSAGTERRDDE